METSNTLDDLLAALPCARMAAPGKQQQKHSMDHFVAKTRADIAPTMGFCVTPTRPWLCAHVIGTNYCEEPLKTELCLAPPLLARSPLHSASSRPSQDRYAWGFNWQAQLPAAYVLAKPSRHFQKARPIVNFSKAWPSRIGQALSIVLKMMCTTVFPTLAPDLNIRDVLRDVRRIFASYQDEPLTLQQLDIAGFYNQVEHGRIIQALEFIVHRYCFLQQVSPDSEIQASMRQHERTQRTFRGRYRAAGTNYKSVRIEDVVPLCKFLLTHSFLTVGYQAYRQIQGASMGSQWAPVMCAAVALVREWAFHQSLPRNVSLPFVIYRYVDNCIFIGAESQFTHSWSLLRTWPSFYSAPIELERVQTDEALGFRMCCQQRAITYIQPVARALRSPASSGPSQHVLTGFTARARIILRSTWPRSLICPQFQDLISVHLRMGFPLQLLLQELRMLVDSDNRVARFCNSDMVSPCLNSLEDKCEFPSFNVLAPVLEAASTPDEAPNNLEAALRKYVRNPRPPTVCSL